MNIEEKPQEDIEEVILMGSIEIKNELENEQKKLKKAGGRNAPIKGEKKI